VLPLLLAGRVRLLDHGTLRRQLGSLERRPGEGARERVDHPQTSNAHDDVAAAVAGALVAAFDGDHGYSNELLLRVFGDDDDRAEIARRELARHAWDAYASPGAPLIPHDVVAQFELQQARERELVAKILAEQK
jgi:hypothetical protein